MDISKFEIIGSVSDIQVIAVNRAIRELKNLRKLFGAGRWRKLKGVAKVKFSNGVIFQSEVHWYEAHGIGRRKMKIKRLIQRIS